MLSSTCCNIGHEDVAAGRVRWSDLTPAEWRQHAERRLAEAVQTGSATL